jgi:hypothetical protein
MADDIGEQIVLRLVSKGDGWAGRIKQTIIDWSAAGMGEKEIIDRLRSELQSGGSIFEGIMKGFGEVTGESVDYVSIDQLHEEWGGENAWEWITRRDNSVCNEVDSDCEYRDGEIKTWEEWQAMGLPGTGTTTCAWRCRCILRPVDVTNREIVAAAGQGRSERYDRP